MGLKTLKKEIIQAVITTSNELNPPELSINTSPSGGFMFSIMLFGFDLSTGPRLFDFTLVEQTRTTGFVLAN